MPFTRPAQGQEITAADFGQPVYDELQRQGFSQMGQGATTIAPNVTKQVSLPVAIQARTAAFTPNGDSSGWTCNIAGIYQCFGIYAAGGNAFPPGTYLAITRGVIVMNRMVSAGAVAGNGFVYETISVSYTGVINVGDVFGLQIFSSGGAHTANAGGGSINDPQTPSLHIWRVSL